MRSPLNSRQPAVPAKLFCTPSRMVGGGAVVVLLLAVGFSGCSSGDQANQSAQPVNATRPAASSNPVAAAPPAGPIALTSDIRDAQVKTLDGGSLKLSDYDNKVVVLNIWATWCGPCRLEMPDLVKLNQEYKSRGLVVLGLATTYNERNDQVHVKEFLKTQKVDYRILWDDGTLAAPLVQIVGGRSVIPPSFVISRDGRIVKHFQGFSPLSTPALMRQAVEEALNDKGKA